MQSSAENAATVPTVIGVDLGKDVFHMVGFDADGNVAFRRNQCWLRVTGGGEYLVEGRLDGIAERRL